MRKSNQCLVALSRLQEASKRSCEHPWPDKNPAENHASLYYYYRLLPDNRFLLGGRRDLIPKELHNAIGEMWPGWRNAEVAYRWRDLICVNYDLRPFLGQLPDDPSVIAGFGYHGTGVSTGTWVGREIAHFLTKTNSKALQPDHVPGLLHGLTPKIPFSFLKKTYARTAFASMSLQDRWH